MQELTEQVEAALVEQHGEGGVEAVKGPGPDEQWYAIRRPTKPEYERFKRDVGNDAKSFTAQREICARLCVFPGPAEILEAMNKYPGFADTVTEVVVDLAGYEKGAERKKLGSGQKP